MEQGLRSGACAAVLAWPDHVPDWSAGTVLRRLQLAADAGDALAVLLRDPSAAAQPSPAALRLAVQSAGTELTVTLLKQRGGRPGSRIQIGS
jgi:hypothetical protein